jgi:hypothetical protein
MQELPGFARRIMWFPACPRDGWRISRGYRNLSMCYAAKIMRRTIEDSRHSITGGYDRPYQGKVALLPVIRDFPNKMLKGLRLRNRRCPLYQEVLKRNSLISNIALHNKILNFKWSKGLQFIRLSAWNRLREAQRSRHG